MPRLSWKIINKFVHLIYYSIHNFQKLLYLSILCNCCFYSVIIPLQLLLNVVISAANSAKIQTLSEKYHKNHRSISQYLLMCRILQVSLKKEAVFAIFVMQWKIGLFPVKLNQKICVEVTDVRLWVTLDYNILFCNRLNIVEEKFSKRISNI